MSVPVSTECGGLRAIGMRTLLGVIYNNTSLCRFVTLAR